MAKHKTDRGKIDYQRKMLEKGLTPKSFSYGFGGSSNSRSNSYDPTSNDFTAEDLEDWLLNPEESKENIINASRYFYISRGQAFKVINYYTDLLRLDYNLIPEFKTLDLPDKESLFEQIQEVRNYVEQALSKPTVRKIIKFVLKEGAYYGYEMNEGDVYYIRTLPSKYCRVTKIVNGLPVVEFNTDFFSGREKLKESYPQELRGNKTGWIELNHENTIAILAEEDDFTFPYLSGSMLDMLDLEDFYKYLKKGIERAAQRVLIQKGELDEEGEPKVDEEIFHFYHQAIEQALDGQNNDTVVVSTLFDVDSIDFTKSKANDGGYTSVDSVRDKVAVNTGVPDAVLGKADSATAISINHTNNISFVMSILEKIEFWANYRLKRRFEKDGVYFKLRYLPVTTSRIDAQPIYEKLNKLLGVGGSLLATISAAGFDPFEYMNLVILENILDIKNELMLPPNINTASSNDKGDDVGRPESNPADLTDGGEQTVDTDGNDR